MIKGPYTTAPITQTIYHKQKQKGHQASNGAVLTEKSETLKVVAKGLNEPYGIVKLVPKIGQCLLSVGQMANDPEIDINFKGSSCTIKRENMLIDIGTKGDDKLYRIMDSHK